MLSVFGPGDDDLDEVKTEVGELAGGDGGGVPPRFKFVPRVVLIATDGFVHNCGFNVSFRAAKVLSKTETWKKMKIKLIHVL